MRSIIVVICLGLLLCVEPVGAQTVQQLTVSVHKELGLGPIATKKMVKAALEGASFLLQVTNNCPVRFELKGTIKTFDGPPVDIDDKTELEEVHNVDADVKIVRTITFCKTDGNYYGCAWRPEAHEHEKTVIIALRKSGRGTLRLRRIVLAHEFGHTRGLPHRTGQPNALMSPSLSNRTLRINADPECKCFGRGQGAC
jgi:hypothetical protein